MQRLIDLQSQIERAKAKGDISAVAPLQTEFNQISSQLGGDTPCAVGSVQEGSSAARAPAPVPLGCAATTSNFAQVTAVAIPTGPAVVTSTVVVAGAGSYLWDVDLTTNIVHSFPNDLDITIQSPAGTVVTLTTDNGGGNDNVFNGTLWDDGANPLGQVPYTANNGLVTDHVYAELTLASPLVPEESLAAFVGENPNGTWTITISDDQAGDGGSLNSWALAVTTFPQAAPMSAVQSFNQTTTVAIPTGPAVVNSTLVVSGATGRVCKAVLRTNILHSFSADLDVTLTSPAGTIVTLTTDNGAGNNNVFSGTAWDDDANPAGALPYTNNNGLATDHAYADATLASPLVPEESMGAFMGEDANGTWTLTVSDDLAGDGGSINAWGLDVTGCSCVGDLTLAVIDTPDPVTSGTAITYVATATNTGPGDVTNASISVPMAAGTTFVSATPSAGPVSCTLPAVGSVGTATCTWTGATAEGAGNARSVTMVVGVPAAAVPGANLVVNATTSATPPDLNAGNNSATATTTVRAPASSPAQCAATTSNFAQTAAVAIPTGPAVVTSTIVVADAGSYLWDVDLTTNIVHTFPGDLDITIQSPAGTVVTLTTDNGAENDNVFNGTQWDDDANPLGQVPYTANNGLVTDHAYAALTLASPLVPEESFAAFVGENPNGTWTITISDDQAGDGGRLDRWALVLTTFPQAVQTSAVQSFNQTTAVAIPTGPAVVTSTLAVSGVTNPLHKAVVRTTIPHSFSADLDMTLTSPAGTIVTLTTDNGAGNNNVFSGTAWDDDANPAGALPYTNNNGLATDHAYVDATLASPLEPEESMGAFMGEDANGTWTLTVSDDLASDGGSVNAWGLDLTGFSCGGDLTLAVTDTPDPATPGTAITYVATATNNGPVDVTNASISLPMASGTTFVSATPSAGPVSCTLPAVGSEGTATCTWTGATAVGAGNARALTMVVGVPASAVPGANLVVNATTRATPPDLNTGNNGATATTTVGAGSADLLAGLTSDPLFVSPGGNLTYTAWVTNLGISDAQNAQISLPLPAGTSFVSATGLDASCSGTTTVVCVWAGATAPTVTRTATIVALVASPFVNGNTVSASNTVSSVTADPVGTNNTRRAVSGVVVVPPVLLTFTSATVVGDNNRLDPNDCNALTVRLTNSSGAPLTGISAVLSSTTPGVTITQPNSPYPDINSAASGDNSTAFQVVTASSMTPGSSANFTLTVTLTGVSSPQVVNFTLPVGTAYTFTTTPTGATLPAGGTFIVGSAADDALVITTMPFAFSVFGTAVAAGETVVLSTNGNVQFVPAGGPLSGSISAINVQLPAAIFQNAPVLMPYWDDADLTIPGGGIYTHTIGSAPNRQFIVEWRGVHFGDKETKQNLNFGVIFSEGNSAIEYRYVQTGVVFGSNGRSATVGLQAGNSPTSAFAQYSLNQAVITPGLTINATATAPTPGPGVCVVNTDPVITPVGVTRAQGSANFRSVIANVSNAGGAGNVTVTAAPATGSGVVITGIQNNNGVISALIRAGCLASSSTFSLTANNGSSSNVATLPVTVTPGSNPTWCQWWPR